jgi:hypothetical protein
VLKVSCDLLHWTSQGECCTLQCYTLFPPCSHFVRLFIGADCTFVELGKIPLGHKTVYERHCFRLPSLFLQLTICVAFGRLIILSTTTSNEIVWLVCWCNTCPLQAVGSLGQGGGGGGGGFNPPSFLSNPATMYEAVEIY